VLWHGRSSRADTEGGELGAGDEAVVDAVHQVGEDVPGDA
jgi:hypothetical protein